MPTDLERIDTFVRGLLGAERHADDTNGVYLSSSRSVTRLGLALEPDPGLYGWVQDEGVDALLLHRPWRLDETRLAGVGVLAYHLAFDEALTLGYNPRLAAVLGLTGLEVLGHKEGRPLGMLGELPETSAAELERRATEMFGGLEAVQAGRLEPVTRVAVVGAMNAALVREAAERGAGLYLTGQLRRTAQSAAEETGIGVFAVGHTRSEVWGLRVLAHLLSERFSTLEVQVRPPAT